MLPHRLVRASYVGTRISIRVDPSDVWRVGALIFIGVLGWSLAPALAPASLLLLWTAALALVTVPWLDFHREPLWSAVEWIPFSGGYIRPLDIGVNIVMFIPFGTLY